MVPKSQIAMAGCSHIRAHMLQQEAARVPPERDGSYLAGRSENRFQRRNSLLVTADVGRVWAGSILKSAISRA